MVAEFIGFDATDDDETEIARFWERVETNLRAGKVRLIFAADEIPPELRRVVEFLNEQMNPAEVVAIEIRQYVGTGVRTLVPSVIRSSKRVATEVGRMSGHWDRESFFAALFERRGSESVSLATSILDWASSHCPKIWWGEGRNDGSCFVGITHENVNLYPFAMWTNGRIEVLFQWLKKRHVPQETRELFASRLSAVPGLGISTDAVNGRPSFEMSLLKQRESLSQFFDAVESVVEEIRRLSRSRR